MRFRRRQDEARSATHQLLVLFALTILALVAAINGMLALLWSAVTGWQWRFPALFFETNTAVVLLFVLGGAAVETLRLRAGGGRHVATWVGGRELRQPRDPHEKRLLNVVEEMALASGQVRPSIYVLEREDAINAFAAGWSVDEAVIGITRGALERLTRDELQGLVAHEFGHLQQGDIRLNMILLALVWGLSLVFGYGQMLMSADEEGRRGGPAVLVGMVFVAVGALGWIAGRGLQAAVSRHREFLADACAVQFTRSRDGIGGALRKIWHLAEHGGAGMREPRVAMMAAMLFVAPPGWFMTHPPVRSRVKRLYGRERAPLPSERMRVSPSEAGGHDVEHALGPGPSVTTAADPGALVRARSTPRLRANVATQETARGGSPVRPVRPVHSGRGVTGHAGRPAPLSAASPPLPRMGSAGPVSATDREDRDAMGRLALLHGPLERRSALLALLLPTPAAGPVPPGRPAERLAAWRHETRGLASAERVLTDVQALTPAVRLPWIEKFLDRTAQAPKPEHSMLVEAASRVLQAGGGPSVLERLTLRVIELKLSAGSAGLRPADASRAGADLSGLDTASVRHVAAVAGLLSELLQGAGAAPGAAPAAIPPQANEATADRPASTVPLPQDLSFPLVGWRWYGAVMKQWSDGCAVMPRRCPEDAMLREALADLRALPWMTRPLILRLWLTSAGNLAPPAQWPRDFIDGLRLCSLILDCPMHPDIACAYAELDPSK